MTELQSKLQGTVRQLDMTLYWLDQCRCDGVLVEDIDGLRGELGMMRNKVLGMIEILEMENVRP
jgi:hypothetical protein